MADRTQTELALSFSAAPKLLASASFGGLEEGGDVALLKLGNEDCARVRRKLAGPQRLAHGSRGYDSFRLIEAPPPSVYTRQ
ncbi:hypothetical protein GCM10027188_29290 [Lysobacter humi (ex Lee et al. 2017)]